MSSFAIYLLVVSASNVKPTGSPVLATQLYVWKLDRSQCEQLLNVHGKPQQYVIRESTKVQHLRFTQD